LPSDCKEQQQRAPQQDGQPQQGKGGRSNIVADPSKPHTSAQPQTHSTPLSSTDVAGASSDGSNAAVAPLSATKSPSSPATSEHSSGVQEARRALAHLSPFTSSGTDTDYFESGDLERSNLDDLAASIGLASGESFATTKQGSVGNSGSGSGQGDAGAGMRSLESVQLMVTGGFDSLCLEDFPPLAVEWRQGQLLGSGSFGRVYLGLDDELGLLMAVKQVPLAHSGANSDPAVRAADEQRLAKLAKEISLLAQLQHPNIVEYRGMNIDGEAGQVNIFMDYVPGGSIAHLLKRFGTFSEKLVRRYTKEILQGLAYLHLKGVVHRDIKGGNILVDVSGRCKLGQAHWQKQSKGDRRCTQKQCELMWRLLIVGLRSCFSFVCSADFGASFSLAEVLPPGQKPSIEGTPYWMVSRPRSLALCFLCTLRGIRFVRGSCAKSADVVFTVLCLCLLYLYPFQAPGSSHPAAHPFSTSAQLACSDHSTLQAGRSAAPAATLILWHGR
jgi:hypothetical protein